MNPLELQLHSAYTTHIENENYDKALKTAMSVVEAARADEGINPFERAEALSEAWYQIALIYALKGDVEEAAKAAEKTYRYDSWMFNQHETLVELLLKTEQEAYIELACEIANQHEYHKEEYHEDEVTHQSIVKKLEAYEARWDCVHWLLDEFRLTPKVRAYFDGDLEVEELFKQVNQWEKEGRSQADCDTARACFYDFEDDYKSIVELWKGKDFSTFDDVTIFSRACSAFIFEGVPLPKPLPFPKEHSRDPHSYLAAGDEVLSVYAKYSDYWDENLSEAEMSLRHKALLNLSETLFDEGLAIFSRFFDGEMNGYASPAFIYTRLCFGRGGLYEIKEDFQKAKDWYKKGMGCNPTPGYAFRLIDASIQIKDYGEAWHALQWIKDNYSEVLDYEDTHRVDFLTLRILASAGDLEDFEEAKEDFDQKYNELYDFAKFVFDPLDYYYPDYYDDLIGYFLRYNHCMVGAYEDLVRANPERKDFLAELFSHAKYLKKDIISVHEAFSDDVESLLDNILTDETDESLQCLFKIYLSIGIGFSTMYLKHHGSQLDQKFVEPLERADALAEKISPSIDDQHMLNCMMGYVEFQRGNFQQAYDRFTTILDSFTDPLKPSPLIEFDEEYLDLNGSPKFDLLPDHLRALVHYLRGRTAAAMDPPRFDPMDDYRKADFSNPILFHLWYSAMEASFKQNKNDELDEETIMYVQRLHTALDGAEDDAFLLPEEFALYLAVLSLAMIKDGFVEEAQEVLVTLKEKDPNHPFIARVEEALAAV